MNFGGRGGMGNMNQMLKQAQAMQAKMMKAQEELKEARVEGSAGGGMVSATVNGQGELVGVEAFQRSGRSRRRGDARRFDPRGGVRRGQQGPRDDGTAHGLADRRHEAAVLVTGNGSARTN